MIQYTIHLSETGLSGGEIVGFMVDLWNEFGNISCRTILNLPDGQRDMHFWFYADVVAIPDLKISFRTPKPLTHQSIFKLISQEPTSHTSMAAALAATVMVMDLVTDRECEHWDGTTNLAECCNTTMDFDFDNKEEDLLPF